MKPRRDPRFVPYSLERLPEAEMRARAQAFRAEMARRRSVRHFSAEPVPLDVIDACIAAAGLAPSGANRQPWTFVVVTDAATKRTIRLAAEAEERELYEHRISDEWREALEPLGTTWEKPFLETAPVLIVLFRHVYDLEEGRKKTNYYTQESVGIALGFLIVALHRAGLATLTHTPSPMGFLGEILGRPANEKAYVLLPVGRPAPDCVVPDLEKKALDEIRVRGGDQAGPSFTAVP
jgi:iodotyrosine deiodinase